MEVEMIGPLTVGVSLFLNSIFDMVKRQVSLTVSFVCGAIGILLWIGSGNMDGRFLRTLVPGICLLLLAWASKGKVGYGDGIVLLSAGMYFTDEERMVLCMAAFAGAGICGLLLCAFFHKGKNYEMPFVPFLFLGYLIVRWITWRNLWG